MEINIKEDIILLSTDVSYAEELYGLINKNRSYLEQWLPKTNQINSLEKYKEIILNIQKRFETTKTGVFVIKSKAKLIGTLDLQLVDKDNNIGGFGYWLDKDYQGRGIITQSLKKLIEYAFTEVKLHKLIILCVAENIQSINVARRLGFEQEAILKQEFLLHDKYHDLIRYYLLNMQ